MSVRSYSADGQIGVTEGFLHTRLSFRPFDVRHDVLNIFSLPWGTVGGKEAVKCFYCVVLLDYPPYFTSLNPLECSHLINKL